MLRLKKKKKSNQNNFILWVHHSSPLGVIEEDEHAGSAVILETLVVMAIGVADQIVKDGCINHIKEPRPRVVWGHFLHRLAVAFIILPPMWKNKRKSTFDR